MLIKAGVVIEIYHALRVLYVLDLFLLIVSVLKYFFTGDGKLGTKYVNLPNFGNLVAQYLYLPNDGNLVVRYHYLPNYGNLVTYF